MTADLDIWRSAKLLADQHGAYFPDLVDRARRTGR
jgi:hypothetical protein